MLKYYGDNNENILIDIVIMMLDLHRIFDGKILSIQLGIQTKLKMNPFSRVYDIIIIKPFHSRRYSLMTLISVSLISTWQIV